MGSFFWSRVLPRIILERPSVLYFLQFYGWQTTSESWKVFFDAVVLFENSSQSSMYLGLTFNAQTNREHFFLVFFIREYGSFWHCESLVVTMIYVSRLLFVIDISSQMVYIVDSFTKREDFANNQRGFSGTCFARIMFRDYNKRNMKNYIYISTFASKELNIFTLYIFGFFGFKILKLCNDLFIILCIISQILYRL